MAVHEYAVSTREQIPFCIQDELAIKLDRHANELMVRVSAEYSLTTLTTVCALIIAGFNIRGFRGSAPIRECFVRECLNITVNEHAQIKPIDVVMSN